MKNFKQLVRELPSNKVVVAFGQFQPPTAGHELLVKTVQKVGESIDHVIFTSVTEDKKNNPLPTDRKIYFLKRMFPEANFVPSDKSILETVQALSSKYKHITVVAASDSIAKYEKELKECSNIKIISTGGVDPDNNTVSAISGVRMCESAKRGNFTQFKKGVPHTLTELDSRRLMNDVRKGMGLDPLREEINLVNNNIREQYFRGEIFNVGEFVESAGNVYEIIKRGSNHLLLKNNKGNLVTKWVTDVQPVTEEAKVTDVKKVAIRYKEFMKKSMSSEKPVDIAKPEIGGKMAVLPADNSPHDENTEQYNMAAASLAAAKAAREVNNLNRFHAHMANYHDHIGNWHKNAGRDNQAEKDFEIASQHHGEAMKHPFMNEETLHESYGKVEHHKDHKIISHGPDVQIKIDKKHHDKISKLEHGDRHIFKHKDNDLEYGVWRDGDHLHFKQHSLDSGLYSNMSLRIPQSDWEEKEEPTPEPKYHVESEYQADDRDRAIDPEYGSDIESNIKKKKKLKEDAYTSDFAVKKVQGPDGEWKDRKYHPKKITFADKFKGSAAKEAPKQMSPGSNQPPAPKAPASPLKFNNQTMQKKSTVTSTPKQTRTGGFNTEALSFESWVLNGPTPKKNGEKKKEKNKKATSITTPQTKNTDDKDAFDSKSPGGNGGFDPFGPTGGVGRAY